MLSAAEQRTANMLGALAVAVNDRLTTGAAAGVSGIGGSAAAALTTLLVYRDREMSIERLRLIVGLSHSATVRLVDRLCRAGLATRRDGCDGREVALALTRAGRRTAERLLGERQQLLDSLVAELTPRERVKLARLLEPLLAAMTAGRREARHICRLCDHAVCQAPAYCPVDNAATDAAQ